MTTILKDEQKQQEATNQSEIVQMAIRCSKQGQKAVARSLLAGVCSRDPNHEMAWMWRASLAESATEGLECLEQVLRINPQSVTALAWLEKATRPTQASARPVVQPVAAVIVPAVVPPAVAAPPPIEIAQQPAVEEPVVASPRPVTTPSVTPDRLRAMMNRLSDTHPSIKVPEIATVTAPAPVVVVHQNPVPAKVKEDPSCPFCGTRWLTETEAQCSSCGGMPIEKNPGDFARNTWLDKNAMEANIERLRKLADGTKFEQEYLLAVAYMNVLNTGEGLKQAKRAIDLCPEDPRVASVLRPYLARPRVMVVDDSATIREVVTRTLEKNGYAAVAYPNGLYALGEIGDLKPAMVLLDITMPVIDGYKVCESFKKNPETKDIPVVMLSGKDGIFDKVKGRMAGASEYITKPFKAEGLLKTVSKYAARQA